MKKFSVFLLIAVFLFSMMGAAGAATYTFNPNDGSGDPNDLNDLDHWYYYSWGINWSVPSGESIVSASLFFDDIRNWDSNPNVLYVHLLDTATEGVSSGYDAQGGGDYFAGYSGDNYLLNTWINLPAYPQDITYNFDADEKAALIDYVIDGNFGLGFDPDCHFYNSGITLTIVTEMTPVPEPATMLLLGSGLIGMAGFRRKIKK